MDFQYELYSYHIKETILVKEPLASGYAFSFRLDLKADGILVLYSNEQGFIRKQLRIRNDYRLLAEQCIREKDQFYLFVIQYKG